MITQKTISVFDRYSNEQLDKMGSDYFPLSVKLERFKGLTLGYIRENTKFFEVTQEIAEDIQPLFVRLPFELNQNLLVPNIFNLKVPENLFRLGSLKPFKSNLLTFNSHSDVVDSVGESESQIKKLSIIKDGEEAIFNRSPFRKATPEYPNVLRYSNQYRFDFGQEPKIKYNKCIISYIRFPKFGEEADDLLVDLPDVLVERIISKTCDSLRFQTSDEAAAVNLQFNRTYSNN